MFRLFKACLLVLFLISTATVVNSDTSWIKKKSDKSKKVEKVEKVEKSDWIKKKKVKENKKKLIQNVFLVKTFLFDIL